MYLKAVWMVCGFAVFASTAIAAPQEENPARNKQQCTRIAELAGAFMELRQMGEPMQNLIKEERRDYTERLSNQLVIKAYTTPRLSSPQAVKDAIQDFSNEAFRNCYSDGRIS